MKCNKIFLSIVVGCFSYLHVNSQSVDSVACKKVEDTLSIIENFLADKNSDPHLNRISAVSFLIDLAKIPYEGKVTFIGREFPAKSFYTKCKDWYIANKEKLVWDISQSKVVLKK